MSRSFRLRSCLASLRSVSLLPRFANTLPSPLSVAFRHSRREKASAKNAIKGRRVLSRIKSVIKELEISVQDWFDMMDGSGEAASDGKVSLMELRNGLSVLIGTASREHAKRPFTENEIISLVRYLDPNADGDLTMDEVADGIKRSDDTMSAESIVHNRNQATLCLLEEHMKKKGIRLTDLFTSLDTGGDSLLSPEELLEGFATIADPSKRGRLNPPVMGKDKAKHGLATPKKGPPPKIITITIRVHILDDNASLIQEQQVLRLNSPPAKPLKYADQLTKSELSPKFLEIADDEITQLSSQLERLFSYPIRYNTLLDTLHKLPQISAIITHVTSCWDTVSADIVKRIHDAEAGSVDISDEELKLIVAFLDPNGDGEIDLEELNTAFRLTRRGRAGIERRNETLAHLKDRKAVTPEELLAEKGVKILQEQERVAALKKSKKEELVEKKRGQLGRMVSKKDLLIRQHSEKGAQALLDRQKGKDQLAADQQKQKEEEAAEALRKEKEEFGGFTQYELDVVVNYMDPSGDNEITMDELMHAFRTSRRAKAVEKTTIKGRAVLSRILNMITVLHLELDDFFEIMDSAGQGKSDGEISTRELKIGVKKLSELIRMMYTQAGKDKEAESNKWRELSDTEVVLLMKVCDPSGDGDLTIDELRKAIEQSQEMTEAQKIEARVGGVFNKLEKLMKDKGMRMQDLFLSFGGDDGSISQGELKDGLKKLNQAGARERSEEKRALEAALQKKIRDEKMKQEIEIEIARIEDAENSGTAEVLRKFETLMNERGMRVADLFRAIDKTGDGLISPDELKYGLRLLAQPCAAATFAHKKALQKEVEKHEKEVKKRSDLRHFLTKQKEAMETGAAEVIERLEAYLRNHQLRVSDLFKQIDQSGDGALDEEEFRECLKGMGIDMNADDVHLLMTFLDCGGNGTVEAGELNDAIRNYRRFRWEAQVIDLDADYRNPLHEEFKGMPDIFHSSDLFEDGLSKSDVETGLKRLRGDDFGEDDLVLNHKDTSALRSIVDKLAAHLHSLNMRGLGEEFNPHGDEHRLHNIRMSEVAAWMTDCREVEKDITAHDILTQSMSFDDESSLGGSLGEASMVSAATEVTSAPLISINLNDFDAVASFLDGGDGQIEMKELEVAFRMARRSLLESQLKEEAVVLMKRLRKLIEYKKLPLDKFISMMDSATGKSTSGLAIGDGNITAREFQVGLLKICSTLDKKHRHLKFKNKEIERLLKFIDGKGTGNMSAAVIKSAFFSDESPMELEKRFKMEAEAAEENPMEAVDDLQIENFVVPEKDSVTVEDIAVLLANIDETEDGDVNIGELEALFRGSRRDNAAKRLDDKAVSVLKRLWKIMKKVDVGVDDLFKVLDGANGNGIVTGREFKVGVQGLCKDAGVSSFAENDLVFLLRYMDPSGEGDLSKEELHDAFGRAKKALLGEEEEGDSVKEQVTKVIQKLEGFMKSRGMRLSDLFYWLDKSGDGKVSYKELQNGLERLLFGQSTEDRLEATQLLAEAKEKEKVETQARMKEQKEKDDHFKHLEACGAGDVLRKLEGLMKDKGMRIHDVFHIIDESGDGVIDKEELVNGLAKIIQPTKHVAASKLAKEKKRERALAEKQVRRDDQNRFLGQIEESERCGADKVIHRLEKFMRKRQMKLSDLFLTLDKGGDGELTAEELMVALEKERLFLGDDEVINLMDFLDKGGDGNIDAKELESAIKLHRRFAWEQKNKGKSIFSEQAVKKLCDYLSGGGAHNVLNVGMIDGMIKLSMEGLGITDDFFGMTVGNKLETIKGSPERGERVTEEGVTEEGVREELRPSTSQQGSRGGARGGSRMGAREEGRARTVERVAEEEGGLGGVEAAEDAGGGLAEQEVVESYLSELYGEVTAGAAEVAEVAGAAEVAVEAVILGDRPDSRPVTAPTGNFEFDLSKGGWAESGLLLSDYDAAGGEGDLSLGDASSVVIGEMKKTLDRKDKQIEMLMKEVERLQGQGRGEGSVVSELTALDV